MLKKKNPSQNRKKEKKRKTISPLSPSQKNCSSSSYRRRTPRLGPGAGTDPSSPGGTRPPSRPSPRSGAAAPASCRSRGRSGRGPGRRPRRASWRRRSRPRRAGRTASRRRPRLRRPWPQRPRGPAGAGRRGRRGGRKGTKGSDGGGHRQSSLSCLCVPTGAFRRAPLRSCLETLGEVSFV